MAEHTPGRWIHDEEFGEIRGDEAILIAIVDGSHSKGIDWTPFDEERDANARLIAAAPDLLAALYAAQAAFAPETIADPTFDPHGAVGPDEAVGLMLAAIAKARGE